MPMGHNLFRSEGLKPKQYVHFKSSTNRSHFIKCSSACDGVLYTVKTSIKIYFL